MQSIKQILDGLADIGDIAPAVSTQVASTTRVDFVAGIEAALRACNIRFTTDWETGKFRDDYEEIEIEAECTFAEMEICVQLGLLLIINRHYGIDAKSFEHPLAFTTAIELRGHLGGLHQYMRPYCWWSIERGGYW